MINQYMGVAPSTFQVVYMEKYDILVMFLGLVQSYVAFVFAFFALLFVLCFWLEDVKPSPNKYIVFDNI